MKRLLYPLGLACLILIPHPAGADTWHVPSQCPTIKAGIDSASAGDTVLVAPGLYLEHDIDVKSGICLRGETGQPENVIIDAEEHGRVLRCQGVDSTTAIEGFTIRGGSHFLGGGMVCYLSAAPRVRHCTFLENASPGYGGAVYCDTQSSPSFTYCVFSDNSATTGGGGICLDHESSAALANCTFFGNSAPDGGGLHCCRGSSAALDRTIVSFSVIGEAAYRDSTSMATFTYCDVYGNAGGNRVDCPGDQPGAGCSFFLDPMFCNPAYADFHLMPGSPCADAPGCGLVGAYPEGCRAPRVWCIRADGTGDAPTIQAGMDSAWAGDTLLVAPGTYREFDIVPEPGVALLSEAGAESTIIDAEQMGRVLYCDGLDSLFTIRGFTLRGGTGEDGGAVYAHGSSLHIADCFVVDNSAARGAGVHCLYSRVTVGHSVLAGNSASSLGGGLYNRSSTVSLEGCTLSGNSAGIGGAGMCLVTYSAAQIMENTIIALNAPGEAVRCYYMGPWLDISCCDIYGNEGGDWVGCIESLGGVNGNFSVDPMFCDPDSGDYHLAYNSPCLDVPGCGLVGALGEGCPLVGQHITVLSPNGGEVLKSGLVCEISWSAQDIQNVSIAYGGDTTWMVISPSVPAGPGSYLWTVPEHFGDWLLRICDAADGDPCDYSDSHFTISPQGGRVWHVPSQCPTIKAGIDSASAGDTVLVACGTYYERNISLKNGVCVRSETGEASCATINAAGTVFERRVLHCVDVDNTARLEGFTIRGGANLDVGGGAYCRNASPTFRNCVFMSNLADSRGGGMYCEASWPILVDCEFRENSAYFGGGLYCHGVSYTGVAMLRNCVLFANSAQDRGGGVHCESSSPVLVNCTFCANTAVSGGALYCRSSSHLGMSGSIVAFSEHGGSVVCDGTSSATLSCCDVYGNTGGDWGGCLAGQLGVNGNFCADPLFYGPDTGDLRLCGCSPCADAAGCGLVGALGVVPARLWVVHPDGSGDAPTVAAAVDSASTCDTVLVFPGTYYESDILVDTGCRVMSASGPDVTTIDANGQGRVFLCEDAQGIATIEGLTLTGGSGEDGGAIYGSSSTLQVGDCRILGNIADYGAGVRGDHLTLTIRDCVLAGNFANVNGGGVHTKYSMVAITGCTISDNAALSRGGGIYTREDDSLTVANSIIALNGPGEALYCSDAAFGVDIRCSDIYGNTGGDWVGCIAGQDTANGNFIADPLFCSPDSGNYDLAANSPCLDAPGCGLVGALGEGCPAPEGQVTVLSPNGGEFLSPGAPFEISWSTEAVDSVRIQYGDGGSWTDIAPSVPAALGHHEWIVPRDPGDWKVRICDGADGYPCDESDSLFTILPHGHVWYVPYECATIQAGIDSASAGDTVFVACGTYQEYGIHLKSGVCVRSESGEASCATVDATGTSYKRRAFYCADVDSTARLEGFTVTGGANVQDGGAMYCLNAFPTVANCVFTATSAERHGGAVYCEGSSPEFGNCTLCMNRADVAGGGIYCCEDSHPRLSRTIVVFSGAGGSVVCDESSSATLSCCDVYGNVGGDWVGCIEDQQGVNGNFAAEPLFYEPEAGDFRLFVCSPCTDAQGCGLVGALGVARPARVWEVYADGSGDLPTIKAAVDSASTCDTVLVFPGTYYEKGIHLSTGCRVIGEAGPDLTVIDARRLGRILSCESGKHPARIESLTLTRGHAYEDGGAIYASSATLHVANCHILDSNADYGGAVRAYQSSLSLADCVIADNFAWLNGGGVHSKSSNLSISGCTIVGNTALTAGGGIYTRDDGSVTIANTILAFNGPGKALHCHDPTYDVGIACCDIYGNEGGDWVGCIEGHDGVDGNFSADPVFCNLEQGDYALHECSPCMDTAGCGQIGALGIGCQARRWYVRPDGMGDAPTVQAAVDSALGCDTVLVAAGTYRESVLLKHSVQVVSESGPGSTRVEWPDSGSCVVNAGDTYGVPGVTGFTIDGGFPRDADPDERSGAYSCVYVGGSTSLSIAGCILQNALANGVECREAGRPIVGGSLENANRILTLAGVANFASDTVDASYNYWGRSDHGCPENNYGPVLVTPMFDSSLAHVLCGCYRLCVPEDYGSIQGAVDVALAGDTVEVAASDAVYEENVAVVGKNLRLGVGEGEGRPTIRSSVSPVVLLSGLDSTAAFEGFAVDAASGMGGIHAEFSGGIISGCRVTGAVGGTEAAGLTLTGSALRVTGTEVAGNRLGIVLWGSDAELVGNRVVENEVGVRCEESLPLIGGSLEGANDIFGNAVWNLESVGPDTVGADFNYWGTVDYEEILGGITGPVRLCFWTDSTHTDTFSCEVSGVEDGGVPVPSEYVLAQNAPNPFNPETVIGFAVPSPGGWVELGIYDIQGRLVRRLVEGHRAAGIWRVRWDGRDERDVPAASGIYFCRMKADNFTATRKMVLMQ